MKQLADTWLIKTERSTVYTENLETNSQQLNKAQPSLT